MAVANLDLIVGWFVVELAGRALVMAVLFSIMAGLRIDALVIEHGSC